MAPPRELEPPEWGDGGFDYSRIVQPVLDRHCVRCHDGDNDPDFNFATYWPQIMHKGLDKYDDPKVHQGVDAKPASEAAK